MSKLYKPVASSTFVNITSARVVTLKVATHNAPVVTVFAGPLGRTGTKATKSFDSREDARDYAERRVNELVDNGYVQVA